VAIGLCYIIRHLVQLALQGESGTRLSDQIHKYNLLSPLLLQHSGILNCKHSWELYATRFTSDILIQKTHQNAILCTTSLTNKQASSSMFDEPTE